MVNSGRIKTKEWDLYDTRLEVGGLHKLLFGLSTFQQWHISMVY